MSSIAVIGGGKIGEALIAGLIAGGTNPKNIHVTNRSANRSQYLREKYEVVTFDENGPAVDGVDVVFVCVKPQAVLKVVDEIAEVIDNNDATTVVSMAAGITTAAIEEVLAAGSSVIRVMPNTPMLVGKGMCAVASGRFVKDEHLDKVVELLDMVGSVCVVSESDMDAVTALSGSSPAYLFLFTEAMIDAGVNLGLSSEASRLLAVNAFYGAAAMLKETGKHPQALRTDVSSPGGSTIAALRVLEESGIRAAVYNATEACARRSKELGSKENG
ncbi:MAG: pyrroline-5-carboxylate reductase [Corynebacterium sp.]|uniref:pyrroline-5-carboxylate reductase n=1 Tax=Corynebacterium sp. TaxID=1720 RepID=UPI0026DD1D72|nr:pyrroline-5-carboxylate reductase [Corynebacterium sp.]MDO5098949.1 pyrroline-5-carboxylate reductase [Corynebacterium sp.]